MFARGTILKLLILLVGIVVVTVITMWFLFEGYYMFLGVSLVCVVVFGWCIVRLFNRSINKATFMFNAIENDDLTFRFSENMALSSDRSFNAALNRIRAIVQRTRESIVERELYYERILSQSSSGIIVVDGRGIVYQTNDAALGLLGLSSLTHLRQLELISSEVAQTFINVTPKETSTITFYNDVEQKRLSITASYTALSKVGDVKIIAINDIGSQVEDAQLDSWINMSRVLTHEIMNSLAPLTSLSESLRTSDDVAMMHEGLSVIGSTSQSLLRFVENFRRFIRVTRPVMQDFVLIDMLSRCAKLFEDCRLVEVRCPEDLVINGDENLLSQVIVNLVKNGIEATNSGGKVWIYATRRVGFKVSIEVGNDGELIPLSVREHIFVPFFTTKASGSGVGLSLSRQILRMHGGTLTLSPNLERTAFIMTL